MSSFMIDPQEMNNYCQSLGVDIIGIAPVEAIGEGWFKPHADFVRQWVEDGKHAGMEWLAQKLEERCVPQQLLPNVSHAVVLWMHHRFETPPKPEYPTAQVARYAWGRDYHNILRKILRKLSAWIKERVPHADFHGSVDTSPVLERAFAHRASVGWIGKSTMLIHPRLGTYGSLAVLFSTIELPVAVEEHPDRCGTCTDCLDICPTRALSDQGLDSRLCISYWTIEHRGMIPRHMRTQLANWVFGCDLCQMVCPWNNKAGYASEQAAEIWQPKVSHIWPDLQKWLQMSDDELNQSLLGSPLRRAFPHGLKRNTLLVLTEQRMLSVWPEMIFQLQHPNEVVRGTAIWSLSQYFIDLSQDWSSFEVEVSTQILAMLIYLQSNYIAIHDLDMSQSSMTWTQFLAKILTQDPMSSKVSLSMIHDHLLKLFNAMLELDQNTIIQDEIQEALLILNHWS